MLVLQDWLKFRLLNSMLGLERVAVEFRLRREVRDFYLSKVLSLKTKNNSGQPPMARVSAHSRQEGARTPFCFFTILQIHAKFN